MRDVYIVDAVRTPRGRGKAGKGALSGLHPQEILVVSSQVPGLVIDYDLHRALLDGHDAALTRTEFRLLSVLASERGRAMTRDQLQQRVWGVPYRPRDRSVDVCVRKLREKLDHRSAEYDYIHTHYGVGYRFDAILKDSSVSSATA